MGKKMKVLIVSGIFPPDIGGPASYVPTISDFFVKQGHSVTVICFSDVKIDSFDDGLAYKVIRIPRRLFLPYREILTIFNIIKDGRKADIIYSNGNDFKSYIAAKLLRLPCVHKIVGDTSWERAQNRGWFKGTIDDYQFVTKGAWLKFLDWVRAFPIRNASLIITPSLYLKKIVQGWSVEGEKVRTIYNAFTLVKSNNSEKPLTPFEGKTVITVCRLVPWKGVDQIIKALEYVTDLRLVIVGGGELLNPLKKLASDLNISNRVVFTGNIPKEDVAYFLKASDFFILNSSYEGLPHVVLEAMNAGLPVLATDVGGTPEVVLDGKTGRLIKYNDFAQLKKSLKDFSNSNMEVEVFNARELLHTKFSLETMLTETERAMKEIVGRP